MGQGNPVNWLLFGVFLSNAKPHMLRFSPWSRSFNLNILGVKGEGQKLFLCLLFLNNQLKINIPKAISRKIKGYTLDLFSRFLF